MDDQQFQAEMDYHAAQCIAKTNLHSGLITNDEYTKIIELLVEKFSPHVGKLFADSYQIVLDLSSKKSVNGERRRDQKLENYNKT